MANCKICGNPLTGKQISYCCKECAEEGNRRNALERWYSNKDDIQMKKLISNVKNMAKNL